MSDIEDAAILAGHWLDRRNELIVQARNEGTSLRQIGDLVGLSHSAVAKIVARNAESPAPIPEGTGGAV